MSDKRTVLVVDDIANTREDIKRLLYFEEDIAVIGEAGDGEEALRKVEELMPDVILMDINMPGMDGISASEAVSERFPGTAIVIISIQGETEYLRKAMAAGARDYLVKPFSSSDLAETIRRVSNSFRARPTPVNIAAVPQAPQPQRPPSKIIVVFSSKGGVGKTTIACNLGVSLSQDTGRKTALVDLNLQGGDVAVMLNISPKGTISELVQEEEQLDFSLINSYMIPHLSGLKILPAPLRPEEAEVVTASHVEKILGLLKENYEYIIVDCPPFFNEATLSTMEMSDDILLVFTRDLPAIKHVKTDLEVLNTLKQTEKVRHILNQSTLEYGIKINELEKSLNATPAAILPYDEKTVLSSINKGHPLVLTHGNSRIAQSIRGLVAELNHPDSVGEPVPVPKKSLIGKIFSF